jgi:hypothetical protein
MSFVATKQVKQEEKQKIKKSYPQGKKRIPYVSCTAIYRFRTLLQNTPKCYQISPRGLQESEHRKTANTEPSARPKRSTGGKPERSAQGSRR